MQKLGNNAKEYDNVNAWKQRAMRNGAKRRVKMGGNYFIKQREGKNGAIIL